MGSRHECKDALLQLRGHRPPEDLLLARAGPTSRRRDVFPGSFYEHTANCLELACAAEGEIRVATSEGVLRVTPGALLVIQRRVHHAQLLAPDDQRSRVYWYHLQETYAHASVHEHHPDGREAILGWELPGRTNVEGLAGAIVRELASREWDHPSAVAGILNYLTCILVRRALRGALVSRPYQEAPSLCLDSHEAALARATLDFCDTHFREGATQGDVARALGYSPRHLSRLVSRHLGHSISRHLRNLRLREAKYLLEYTDLPVHAIALDVGYTYPEHFIRAFTREVGISPGDYRRSLDGS